MEIKSFKKFFIYCLLNGVYLNLTSDETIDFKNSLVEYLNKTPIQTFFWEEKNVIYADLESGERLLNISIFNNKMTYIQSSDGNVSEHINLYGEIYIYSLIFTKNYLEKVNKDKPKNNSSKELKDSDFDWI